MHYSNHPGSEHARGQYCQRRQQLPPEGADGPRCLCCVWQRLHVLAHEGEAAVFFD